MALVDLIRESIETALTEAEALGREKFLAKYKLVRQERILSSGRQLKNEDI